MCGARLKRRATSYAYSAVKAYVARCGFLLPYICQLLRLMTASSMTCVFRRCAWSSSSSSLWLVPLQLKTGVCLTRMQLPMHGCPSVARGGNDSLGLGCCLCCVIDAGGLSVFLGVSCCRQLRPPIIWWLLILLLELAMHCCWHVFICRVSTLWPRWFLIPLPMLSSFPAELCSRSCTLLIPNLGSQWRAQVLDRAGPWFTTVPEAGCAGLLGLRQCDRRDCRFLAGAVRLLILGC